MNIQTSLEKVSSNAGPEDEADVTLSDLQNNPKTIKIGSIDIGQILKEKNDRSMLTSPPENEDSAESASVSEQTVETEDDQSPTSTSDEQTEDQSATSISENKQTLEDSLRKGLEYVRNTKYSKEVRLNRTRTILGLLTEQDVDLGFKEKFEEIERSLSEELNEDEGLVLDIDARNDFSQQIENGIAFVMNEEYPHHHRLKRAHSIIQLLEERVQHGDTRDWEPKISQLQDMVGKLEESAATESVQNESMTQSQEDVEPKTLSIDSQDKFFTQNGIARNVDSVESIFVPQHRSASNNEKYVPSPSASKGIFTSDRNKLIKASIPWLETIKKSELSASNKFVTHSLRSNGEILEFDSQYIFTGSKQKQSAKTAVKLASKRGWHSITAWGSDEFMAQLKTHGAKYGIEIIPLQKNLLSKISDDNRKIVASPPRIEPNTGTNKNPANTKAAEPNSSVTNTNEEPIEKKGSLISLRNTGAI